MYAIIATGGKQYKAEVGNIIKVEKLVATAGDKLDLDVVLYSDEDGILAGDAAKAVKVVAEVLGDGKGEKIIVYKYKAKKNIRHRQGHRQAYTALKIASIEK